ncbi:MAG TPA: hypothetical protein VHV57_02890 [Acidimicrobiales bacterium]|nr:hypothetical protein [Acidimicrobiales bacterium]
MIKYAPVSEEVQYVEESAQALVGACLAEVRYYGMPFGFDGIRPWERTLAHLLDYGVDLVTDQGTYGITWTSQAVVGYRIDLVRGPLLDVRNNEVQVTHVEYAEPWTALVGSTIESVVVHQLEVTGGEETGVFPTGLSLTFASGVVIHMVSGSWDGDEKPIFPTGDDIIVIWKDESLSKLAPFLEG